MKVQPEAKTFDVAAWATGELGYAKDEVKRVGGTVDFVLRPPARRKNARNATATAATTTSAAAAMTTTSAAAAANASADASNVSGDVVDEAGELARAPR